MTFRGHDESIESTNQDNFLMLLRFLAGHNDDIKKVVMNNTPRNQKMIASDIQKDLVRACAMETTNAILHEVGDEYFSKLVDESHDISVKEQMALAIRFVNSKGCVVERFIGIVHVRDTKASSLKAAIEVLFLKHNLSLSKMRAQGYDGASNMRVGASCNHKDLLQEKQIERLLGAFDCGELSTGTGSNQERSLQRAGDTRWGSHYRSLINLSMVFTPVIEVLQIVEEDGTAEQSGDACLLLGVVPTFEFAFILHLMTTILAITNQLSLALQRKDQDIVNAMALVEVAKQHLQDMRDEGWESLISEVSIFCEKNDIEILDMKDMYKTPGRGRPRRKGEVLTNLNYFRFELFNGVINWQLQELNNRVNGANTNLLLCVSCLSPKSSFVAFNKSKLIELAHCYPLEFSEVSFRLLDKQLETYIPDMRSHEEFSNLESIGDLSQRLVATGRHIVYPLVYLLVKLALVLPVATASVERYFSAMKNVKSRLRNKMGDSWMNDCLVTYIEREIFCKIDAERIFYSFQVMRPRREQL
ncbi:zinc finger MYM-type protein 1-like [Salvia splendens]|uniref:zinc finger MYM-type protein 1-like n=1 Tax=Salvia splendens TaxID=180675 RepID=UPI001C25E598|nr:zinc finger MYM-type protein 1-like [Salvia splendens]